MIYIWLLILLPIIAVSLPVLRVLGVIDWKWKAVFAPIWAPILVVILWLSWFLVPIFVLTGIMLIITGGKPI